MGFKKTLCIDFDGVLHSYTSGWKGIDIIPDPPVPGAIEWLRDLISGKGETYFDVCIYSSRSKGTEGIEAMRTWLFANGLTEGLSKISFPTQKPAAWLTIDDRAICFDGTWPTVEQMDEFVPWTKKIAGLKDTGSISMSAEAPLEQGFGPRFRALRKASGKTLGETAELLRIPLVQLSDIERGIREPPYMWQIDMLAQVAAAGLRQLAAEAESKMG